MVVGDSAASAGGDGDVSPATGATTALLPSPSSAFGGDAIAAPPPPTPPGVDGVDGTPLGGDAVKAEPSGDGIPLGGALVGGGPFGSAPFPPPFPPPFPGGPPDPRGGGDPLCGVVVAAPAGTPPGGDGARSGVVRGGGGVGTGGSSLEGRGGGPLSLGSCREAR